MSSIHQYRIRTICAEDEFLALRPEWTRLYEEVTPQNPFLSFDWTAACWALAGRGAQPFVLTAYDRDQLVGVAPLRLEHTMTFRVLRFIGDGRSDYLGFLRAPDHPNATTALLDHLAQVHSAWDVALLRQICPLYTDLAPAMVPEGLSARAVEATTAPFLSLQGNWEELSATGPSQLRHTRRPARKFERAGGRVECLRGREAAGVVNQIVDVERHSWKARDDAARFQDAPDQWLLQRALNTLGARGELEVWLAHLDGHVVAYLINFVTPERLYYYQGAYDEAYSKHYPGGVLHLHAIHAAWKAGRREYDFMVGNEAYKVGWTNGARTLQHVALIPNTVRGRLAFGVIVAPRWRLRSIPAAHRAYHFICRLQHNSIRPSSFQAANRSEEADRQACVHCGNG